MRLTISALAAASGLFLLGLAIFGQPDVYIRRAQQQLTVLLQQRPDTANPEGLMVTRQITALQQQVIHLEDQLAARQSSADQPTLPVQAQVPAPQTPAPQTPAAQAPPPQTAPAMPNLAAIDPNLLSARAPPQPSAQPSLNDSHASLVAVPERREPAKPPVVSASSQRPKIETAPTASDTSGMQSVLTRLRQRPGKGAATMTATAAAPEVMSQPIPPPNRDAARRHLFRARNLIVSGAMDEAIRTLQEVQLRLVFRPVTSEDTEPPAASPGASDVARALAALGANEPGLGLQFIDRALGDMVGTDVAAEGPGPAAPPVGYAPAYPPR